MMKRIISLFFVLATQVAFAATLSAQSDLEKQIDDFLSDDTVVIGQAVPFSLDGQTAEAREIVRAKIETETEGFSFLQLKTIARVMGDKELERSVLRKAVDVLIKEGFDPLSEGLVIEEFCEIATGSDVDLLTRLMESENLSLPNSESFIAARIRTFSESGELDTSPRNESDPSIAQTGRGSKAGDEATDESGVTNVGPAEKGKWSFVVVVIAIIGILFVVIRAFRCGRSS